MTSRFVKLGILLALALPAGCAQAPTDPTGDVPVPPGQVPPIPINLNVEVSPGEVLLTWTVSDATGVTDYRVYRATSTSAFQLWSSPVTTSFRDTQAFSGSTFRYQVAARRGGLEGERSAIVSATPGLFSLVLEGGAAVTGGNAVEVGSRKIRLGLVAPAGTVAYRVSEDSTLAGSPRQGFDGIAPTAIFTLSPGDGRKTVYVKYEDAGGAESVLISSSILLDTKAIIVSVTESSGGAVLLVNDTLHLTARVDTTGGVAMADIGTQFVGLRLFDDGTNGDPVAFDGSYERNFVIPAGAEVVNALVVASFTDEVGNRADNAGAATRVTIAEPPRVVTFDVGGSVVRGAGIRLEWTRNSDADFSKYRIYRSAAGGTTVSESSTLIASITDREVLTYLDAGLVGGTTYTWGVQAVDQNGFRSALDPLTRALAHDPQLSSTSVSPGSGSPSTVFTYSVTYRHAGSVAPAFVQLIVDANQAFAMTKVGGGSNWVAGEVYQATANLAQGGHTYYFQTVAVDSSSGRNPATPGLVLGGPSVTP